jgi:hypothetical protein
VAAIGLYGDPEWVAEAAKVVHPPTVMPPPPPPPPPREIREDFEQTATGEHPRWARVSGEQGTASVRVVADQAHGGGKCLRIVDAPEAQPAWQPHLYYQPDLSQGTIRQSFAVRVGKDARLRIEWRDASPYPACIGPSVLFLGNGNVEAGGRFLANVPVDTWLEVTIEAPLGGEGTGTFDLTIAVAGQRAHHFPNLPWTGDNFRALHWLGFISEATVATTSFVDDLSLERLP